MKTNPLKITTQRNSFLFLSTFCLIAFFLLCYPLHAKSFDLKENIADTNSESKVDYLEKIYFSGTNKKDMNNKILITIQDLEGKHATAAVAAQYTFLNGIKTNAENAKNACEVANLLAAGIYGLDALEAINQNIPKPNKETSSQVEPALNAASSISNTVSDAAWTKWYLSGGSATGAARTGMTAYKVSAATSMASQTAHAVQETQKLINGLHLSGDKPCKNIPQKDIQIGDHSLPANSDNDKGTSSKSGSINVSIRNITYDQSKSVKSAITKVANVYEVKNDNFSNNAMTMTVVTDLNVSMLLDSIVKVNPDQNFDVTYKSGDDDAQKQIQLANNPDKSKNPSQKASRDVNIQVSGITYDQSKSLTAQLEKTSGISSVKTSAFVGGSTTMVLHTSLLADELISTVKKAFPKTNFEVGAASDQMIVLSHSNNK
jgi:hypothetical protein